MPLVREGVGVTLENKSVVLEVKLGGVEKREKQRNKHEWGRNFREEDSGEEETTFPLPLPQSGYFHFLP